MGSETSKMKREEHRQKTVSTRKIAAVYKSLTFDAVDECRQIFFDFYGKAKMNVNQEEFDEIFGAMFLDTEAHFKVFADNDGRINVFEVFSGAYLLSTEPLHWLDSKIEACFRIFDFDLSNSLNMVEFELLIEACLNGYENSVSLLILTVFYLEYPRSWV